MIVIKTAETSKEYKDFVNFPFSLYKDSKYWVPPISNEELNTMDKSKNPVFKNGSNLPATGIKTPLKKTHIIRKLKNKIKYIKINRAPLEKLVEHVNENKTEIISGTITSWRETHVSQY